MHVRSAENVTVAGQYYGYPGVAFGGYVAGLLASRTVAGGAQVDFRRPVPLGSPVQLTADGVGGELADGQGPFAIARPADVRPGVPAPPTWGEALAATGEYVTEAPIAQPDCFGCGPARRPGGGLRQFLGLFPARRLVAAAWIPAPALGNRDGVLPAPLTWAALDCPGGVARSRCPRPGRGRQPLGHDACAGRGRPAPRRIRLEDLAQRGQDGRGQRRGHHRGPALRPRSRSVDRPRVTGRGRVRAR
jgi:hypothetical protein